jgi:hypothetical protein
MRCLLAVLSWLAVFATATHAQPAPELLWSFQANGSMQAIAAIPDISGDGGPDVVFEGYENGPSDVNHVFAIRGSSSGVGSVIWSARPIGGASSGGGWGDNCLRLGPDLNGDGTPEVLLGTAWGGRTAYALNGGSGATLWSYDTYAHYGSTSSGWIYAMDNLGSDLNGDGVPEIVFCSGSNNDRVHCVSGADGSFRWVVSGGDAYFDIHSCQDIDADGIRDVVAALGDNSPVSPRVVAYAGDDGHLLWQRPLQGTIWNLTLINDVTGDGIREVVAAQLSTNLNCLNGATGAVVWSVAHASQQRVATLDDVNGDGVQDIVIGFNGTRACRVCSGLTGTTLWNTPTSDWTWAVDRIADVTEDGVNDVVAGDFDGYVYLLDGVTGGIFWSWLNPTADKVMTIRGVPDLNGNGVPDVVAGTQLLYGGTGGDVYALEGNTEPTAVPNDLAGVPGLRIGPARPNPATGPITWSLAAERTCAFRLLVLSPDGRCVRDLGTRRASGGGVTPIIWDGRDTEGMPVAAGVYQARVFVDGRQVADRRAVIVR